MKTRIIGIPRRRVDGRAKVTGQTVFADDLMLPRTVHCKLLRSTLPHARIVYKAIKDAAPDPILVSILQLDTLSKFANSENAKLVVPVETAGLLGAAQALRSVLDGVPTAAKP